MTEPSSDLPVIGWREWVQLPDLNIGSIKAKVDSGARSSSIHAADIQIFERDGQQWASFTIYHHQKDWSKTREVEAVVHETRNVKSSNGEVSLRPVIITRIRLLGQVYPVDLTLADRAEMGFRMLLGREAFRNRFLVDAGRSFVGGRPKKKRKTNRDK